VTTGRDPTNQAERDALAEVLRARAGDIAEAVMVKWRAQRSPAAASASPEVARDITRATTAATLAVAEFLATGHPPSDEESKVWLATTKAALRETISLVDLTKLYLFWRDATLDAADGAIRQLGSSAQVAQLAVATIRAGSDGSIVRMTKTFDRERQRLQELVAEEQRRLRHQALHDALTGLPNRVAFLDRLTHALELARRNSVSVAVLFIDIDNFKAVNDLGGHKAGDELLRLVAERLSGATRESDSIARFAGDEFLVLHEQLTDPQRDATAIVERIQQAFAAPFSVGGREEHISISVGVAIADKDTDPEDLLHSADRAMYEAKRDRPPVPA
jgi:diguanylate cyclase (GGDEF)-like protein